MGRTQFKLSRLLFAALGLASTSWPVMATAEIHGATSASSKQAGSSPTAPGKSEPIREISFEKYVLPNGLEVILHRDSTIPLVAVNIWYHVGPVNEPRGRSGFAHLFEHLMFEGSLHVGPNFDRLLEAAGATNSNGTTNWDRTNYFETVPRQHLELLLWIESDRMGFLRDAITQQRLDVQRDVVKNERRQSFENAPYGPSTLALLDTVYPEGHPYHGAVIGSMKDLTAATLDDVHAFADAFYAPSNATLAVTGDFDSVTTKGWIEKYFGPLRKVARPARTPVPPTERPAATRQVIREPVEVAKVTFAWLAPPAYGPENAPLQVLSTILADGKASRLYRTLVVDEQLAVDVDADCDANALATLFTAEAMVASGKSIGDVESKLASEIQRISEVPPTTQELNRAKTRLRLQMENDLQLLNGSSGEHGRAGLLQRFNHYLGDPGGVAKWQQALNQVSQADVSHVAQQYLDATHRVTVVTQPAEKKP